MWLDWARTAVIFFRFTYRWVYCRRYAWSPFVSALLLWVLVDSIASEISISSILPSQEERVFKLLLCVSVVWHCRFDPLTKRQLAVQIIYYLLYWLVLVGCLGLWLRVPNLLFCACNSMRVICSHCWPLRTHNVYLNFSFMCTLIECGVLSTLPLSSDSSKMTTVCKETFIFFFVQKTVHAVAFISVLSVLLCSGPVVKFLDCFQATLACIYGLVSFSIYKGVVFLLNPCFWCSTYVPPL